MTASAQAILKKFEKLSETEKKDVATAILRQCAEWDWPALTDEDLTLIAEERFLALEEEEGEYASKRRTRRGVDR